MTAPSKFGEHLVAFAQVMPRRSFLGVASRALLGAVGFASGAVALPLDRRPAQAQEKDPACLAWDLCGVYGRVCRTCNDSGDGDECCCNCTQRGHYWDACCRQMCNGPERMIRYRDCCGPNGGALQARLNCTLCDNAPENNIVWGFCRAVGDFYCCTVLEDLGPCLV